MPQSLGGNRLRVWCHYTPINFFNPNNGPIHTLKLETFSTPSESGLVGAAGVQAC